MNDVWRSSFSFHDLTALSKSCNVPIPACGTGLTCLPGPNTQIVNGRVTCPAVAACDTNNLGFVPVTAHAAFPPRHSPGVELLKKAVTVGATRWPTGSFVLVGGTGVNNSALTDTWISSNARDWTQVSASGFQGSWWSGYTIDSKSRRCTRTQTMQGRGRSSFVHSKRGRAGLAVHLWLSAHPSTSHLVAFR